MHQNSSGGRGLLLSLGIKESKAPGFWSLLQHQSLKSFLPAFTLGTESFVEFKESMVLLCFIFDNPLPVRILAEATMECISKAVIS